MRAPPPAAIAAADRGTAYIQGLNRMGSVLPLGVATVIIAAAVTWIVTPLVVRLAHLLGAVDAPGRRKIHSEPIPRIGGIAVFCGFCAGLLFAGLATDQLWLLSRMGGYWGGFAAAATGMLLVGLVDDLRGLTFGWKFAAQIVAAVVAWSSGFRIDAVAHPLGGALELGALSLPLTVAWVVAITNAVNLIDGLDGLATGIALITTSTVGFIALARNEVGTAAASIALAGSLAGFLRFNFNPARIFLGDSGSLFLGFVLAVTAVRGSQKSPTVVALLVPLLVLGLPVMDTGLALARRSYRLLVRGSRTSSTARYVLRNWRLLFLPDRGHIHHSLLELGVSHRRAVVLLYSVGLACAACAFGLVFLRSAATALLLVGALLVALAVFVGTLYLRVWKLRRVGRGEPRGSGDRAFVSPQETLGR